MQEFKGIAAKLKRAEENIRNLDSEIEGFFKECDYPVIPQNDRELTLKAIEYHKNLLIPPRFSVLAGEIIHQLRSCFDHIAWHFSIGAIKNARQIEFPVFEKRPVDKNSLARFEGKIQGIADADVRLLIEQMQPYNAPDLADCPLWIIHDFDIVDKHRELIICASTGTTVFPINFRSVLDGYQRAHPELSSAEVAYHFKSHGTTQPNVSFSNFGRRKIEPVTQALIGLFNYTVAVCKEFAEM